MSDLFEPAPKGKVYQCGACGKRSPTRAGFDRNTNKNIAFNLGWDESCMLNCALVDLAEGE